MDNFNEKIGECLMFIQLDGCTACDHFQKKYWNNNYMFKLLNSKSIKPIRFMLSTKDKKVIPKRITSFFEKGMMFPTFIYCKDYESFINNLNNNIHAYGYKLSNSGLLVPDITISPHYEIINKWIDTMKNEPFPLYNPKISNKRTIIVDINKNREDIYRE